MNKTKLSALIATLALLTAGPLSSCRNKESNTTTPPAVTEKPVVTEKKTEPSVHKHNYSDTWDHDDTKHWHSCKDTSCGDKKDIADHTFVWTEKTPAGVHTDKVEKGVCSVCNFETERTAENTGTHEWSTEWKKDETGHWHETTCTGHDVMKKDFSAHEGTWTVKTEAAYQQDRVDERTCTVCAFHEEKTIEGTALTLKPRTITVAKTEFVYDTRPLALDNYIGAESKENRKIEYRQKGTEAYSTNAPSDVGVYEYKITLPETNEWQAAEKTGERKIAQFAVKLTKKEFIRDLGANVVDDRIQLDDIEVQFDTVTKKTIKLVLDKSYDVAGIKKVPATALKIDNPNYALDIGDITEVTLTSYDTADFYCGIQDIFTISGREGVIITTVIPRGTIKTGDSLYIHEIAKSVTVAAMERKRVVIDKATVGEEVSMQITGVTKAEVSRGYTLSKKDTLKEYDRFLATVYVYTEDEGGKHTPLMDSTKETYFPNLRFNDTYSTKQARMFFPEGTSMVLGGETVEDVRFYLPTSTPGFIGRSFVLTESGRTIAKVEITEVHKHDANFYRSGTCYECRYSSAPTMKFDDSKSKAEVECKFIENETRRFIITFDNVGKEEVTYRFTLSDTENFTMVVKATLGNTTYPLTAKGDLVIKAGAFENMAIHVTAKKTATCKVTVSKVVTILRPRI